MEKKVPLRRCCGCMQMKPKTELVRVVKTKDGEVSLDLTGKAQGRGAYLCRSGECFAKARKAKRFERGLSVQIPDEVYSQMEAELEKE